MFHSVAPTVQRRWPLLTGILRTSVNSDVAPEPTVQLVPGSLPTLPMMSRVSVPLNKTTASSPLKKVTVEELSVKEEEVLETSSFQDDLGADSLDVVELVMALEDEFGIEIPDDEVGEIKTVGAAVEYIEKKLPK